MTTDRFCRWRQCGIRKQGDQGVYFGMWIGEIKAPIEKKGHQQLDKLTDELAKGKPVEGLMSLTR